MSDLFIAWIVETSFPLMSAAATFILALALIRLAVHALQDISSEKPVIQ